jgi:tyrosine-protein phosphatase SIW14
MFWRHRYALIFLFTACIAAPSKTAGVDPHAASSHRPARKITVIGISNFGEVTPHLFRGGQPKLTGYEHLKQMGIDLVVDLRLSGEANEKKRRQQSWHEVCLVRLVLHVAPRCRLCEIPATPTGQPRQEIFVHCRYGDDRTGMVIAAYRMADEGWTPEEARKEMEKFGFHHFVCPRLGPYEKRFPEHLKNSFVFADWRNHRAGSH